MDAYLETHTDLLASARAAHAGRNWRASYEGFVRADEIGPLRIDDLDAMAMAAWRLGYGKESVRVA